MDVPEVFMSKAEHQLEKLIAAHNGRFERHAARVSQPPPAHTLSSVPPRPLEADDLLHALEVPRSWRAIDCGTLR